MATVKDIADAVGVSIGTVDRVIHDRGRYSKNTGQKVREMMEELNYTPNIHARGLKQTKKHSFGVVIPGKDQDGGYWSVVQEGILRASHDLASYSGEVNIFPFDHYSSQSFIEALNLAVSSGAEGLLIAPSGSKDIKDYLKNIKIPYIFIDSDIPDLKGRRSYIGQDSKQSGILSGKLMSLLLLGKGDGERDFSLLIVDPPGDNYHLKSRIEGFCEYMNSSIPEVHLTIVKEEFDDRESVYSCMEKSWLECNEIDGIFVANSSVYYVASFLEKKGDNFKSIPLIGYDLIPGKEVAIEKGIINFILTQNPQAQGYRGIRMLYDDIVLKREIEKEVITPLNIITKENLHTFLNQVL